MKKNHVWFIEYLYHGKWTTVMTPYDSRLEARLAVKLFGFNGNIEKYRVRKYVSE